MSLFEKFKRLTFKENVDINPVTDKIKLEITKTDTSKSIYEQLQTFSPDEIKEIYSVFKIIERRTKELLDTVKQREQDYNIMFEEVYKVLEDIKSIDPDKHDEMSDEYEIRKSEFEKQKITMNEQIFEQYVVAKAISEKLQRFAGIIEL